MKTSRVILIAVCATICLIFVGCAGIKPPVPQIREVVCTSSEFDSALVHVANNLKLQTEKQNDSVYQITQWPLNAFESTREVRFLTRRSGDSLKMVSKAVQWGGYGNSGKAPANDFAYITVSAMQQEISLLQRGPITDRRLPKKSSAKALGISMLNPGLGIMYCYSNPMIPKNTTWTMGIGYILLDLDALYLTIKPFYWRNEVDTTKMVSSRPLGILCLILGRALMLGVIGFDLKTLNMYAETPYYFDINEVNGDINVGYQYHF
ncbi:MAG: hypothetical protein RDU76_03820 [Candidatus Edwardsbacteria bacterium]|nr:hypothetical protein [Candidatus Edwardsbacteria bacterium]